jgi:hypothetical protein
MHKPQPLQSSALMVTNPRPFPVFRIVDMFSLADIDRSLRRLFARWKAMLCKRPVNDPFQGFKP